MTFSTIEPSYGESRISGNAVGMSFRLNHSLPSSPKGFVLLPVVMAISLIAAIVYLINREASLNINILGGEIATTEALHAAKAGLNHMLWQLNNSNCSGYTDSYWYRVKRNYRIKDGTQRQE